MHSLDIRFLYRNFIFSKTAFSNCFFYLDVHKICYLESNGENVLIENYFPHKLISTRPKSNGIRKCEQNQFLINKQTPKPSSLQKSQQAHYPSQRSEKKLLQHKNKK